MTAPATQYRRSSFRLPGSRPFTVEDADAMIGHEVSVSLGDVELMAGTITAVKVIDGGENLWITVETGGRGCAVCGHAYFDHHVHTAMRPAGEYRPYVEQKWPWAETYADLAAASLVCVDVPACTDRRITALEVGALATAAHPRPEEP